MSSYGIYLCYVNIKKGGYLFIRSALAVLQSLHTAYTRQMKNI